MIDHKTVNIPGTSHEMLKALRIKLISLGEKNLTLAETVEFALKYVNQASTNDPVGVKRKLIRGY